MTELDLLVIATRADLTAATVTVESFLDHHPGRRVSVLEVEDELPVPAGPPWDGDRLSLDRIGAPAELCEVGATWGDPETARLALLPWAVGTLLDQGAESVLVLPPDAWVIRSLDDLLPTVDGTLAVVPRTMHPIPADGLRPDMADLVSHGWVDDQTMAVAGGLATREVLRWWKQEIRVRARFNRAAGRPGASAPPTIAEVVTVAPHHAVRDPGLGLGVWNLHERTLIGSNEGIRVDGHPLRYMRLSGLVAGMGPVPWQEGEGRGVHAASRALVQGLVSEYLNQVRLVRGAEAVLARRLALESSRRS